MAVSDVLSFLCLLEVLYLISTATLHGGFNSEAPGV